jgi:hypothetical protein
MRLFAAEVMPELQRLEPVAAGAGAVPDSSAEIEVGLLGT